MEILFAEILEAMGGFAEVFADFAFFDFCVDRFCAEIFAEVFFVESLRVFDLVGGLCGVLISVSLWLQKSKSKTDIVANS